MHTVVTTRTFERDAASAGLDDDEIIEMCVWLSNHPTAGVVVPGTGGARKVRFARRSKGKSGGYRTIHYFGGDDLPVFLLALIDKSDRANLSKAERNELARLLPEITRAYRSDVRSAVKSWRN
ncbi:MAG: type II toxin-antitoxin system RelE/ParE family toxin [Propylenella sp.]